MKLTLLQIVQSILSSMSSDEVNSITDSTEALQVASAVRDSYLEIVDRLDNADELFSIYELEASNSSTPTMMTLPEDVESLLWLKYDDRDNGETVPHFKELIPLPLKDFLEHVYQFDVDSGAFFQYNILLNGDTLPIFGYNDVSPKYFTAVDDSIVLFDSYNTNLESSLQSDKSMGFGKLIPSFSFTDSFIPRLDSNQFGLLLNEAKRQAAVEIGEQQNIIAEQRSKRAWVRSQKNATNVKTRANRDRYPNYGRK